MNELIDKLKQFQYTSLKYVDPEDVSNSIICIDNSESLFLYSKEGDKATIDWAVNSNENFFSGLKEAINTLSQYQDIKKIYMEFIPEDYITSMTEYGFTIASEWIDFWNNDLTTICLEQPNLLMIRRIKGNEYQIASEITKLCRDYSRGYSGETTEWMKEWNESENSSIFVAEMNNEIIGICCANLYGFESEKGIVLWLREIAVNPNYHSQKIGLNLMAYAMNWGKTKGAVRSFLACDVENENAIKLYERLGYERKTGRGQINMEKILKQESIKQ